MLGRVLASFLELGQMGKVFLSAEDIFYKLVLWFWCQWYTVYMAEEDNQQIQEAPEAPVVQKQQPALAPEDLTGLEEDKLMAILAYLGALVLVPLIMKRDDAFVLFHAKQGLVLFVGYIIAAIAVWWVAVIGNILLILLMLISVIGVVQASQGKRWKIPVITGLANKFNL